MQDIGRLDFEQLPGANGRDLPPTRSGSDAFALVTRATPQDGDWLLTGRKLFITNAHEADLFIVFATVDPAAGYRGVTAFLVERAFSGFSVGRKEDPGDLRLKSPWFERD